MRSIIYSFETDENLSCGCKELAKSKLKTRQSVATHNQLNYQLSSSNHDPDDLDSRNKLSRRKGNQEEIIQQI